MHPDAAVKRLAVEHLPKQVKQKDLRA